jgi:DNA gyrase inhibitor GyrI
MTEKTIIFLGAATALVALGIYGWKLTSRGAYESAKYSVIEADGPIEIREYDDLIMATTNLQTLSQSDNGSFMRLFRYISGANQVGQKVAMTTPVFMKSGSDTMTGQMGFVIPAAVSQQGVPQPSDKDVQIRERKGGRFAVIRFAGRLDRESMTNAEDRLTRWMNQRGLVRDGATEFAGYDPPWTPGPLRRNEVLIPFK